MQKDKKKEEIHGWGRGREKEGEKKGEEKEKVVEMQTDISQSLYWLTLFESSSRLVTSAMYFMPSMARLSSGHRLLRSSGSYSPFLSGVS